MKIIIILFLFILGCTPKQATEETIIKREIWTTHEANAWQEQVGWLAGCNFIPSTAINQLEMWQESTFDPETIDRELKWASEIGFNSIRVYLHDLLWIQDQEGFLQRMDTFLGLAENHGIGVLFVLLDGVWNPNPKTGIQPEPKPFTHNSGWVQSPGKTILGDTSLWEPLQDYIRGVISHFRNDDRIHGWDVFNEPDNKFGDIDLTNKGEMALKLLKKTFQWSREAGATQPLTAGVWYGSWHKDSLNAINKYMLQESDIISFHAYGNPETSYENIKQLKRYNRPMLCTEYLARGNENTFSTMLPFFFEENIGAYNWGLVDGKTQTIYPWDSWSKEYTKEPDLWHHEIFRNDGSPYKEDEVELIKSLTEK